MKEWNSGKNIFELPLGDATEVVGSRAAGGPPDEGGVRQGMTDVGCAG